MAIMMATAISDPGNEAGQEELADRDPGQRPVEDKGDAGGDHRADRGRRGHDGGGEFRLEAVVHHRLVQDLAQARRIGDGRAGHAGEDHVGDDAHLAEAAGDVADHGLGEPEDPARHPARVHQVRRPG